MGVRREGGERLLLLRRVCRAGLFGENYCARWINEVAIVWAERCEGTCFREIEFTFFGGRGLELKCVEFSFLVGWVFLGKVIDWWLVNDDKGV